MEAVGGGFGGGNSRADVELSDLHGVIYLVGFEVFESVEACDCFSEAFGENVEVPICPEESFAIVNPFLWGKFSLLGIRESISGRFAD